MEPEEITTVWHWRRYVGNCTWLEYISIFDIDNRSLLSMSYLRGRCREGQVGIANKVA